MLRLLLGIGILAATLAGGSGGVFAAALCLYVRCEPAVTAAAADPADEQRDAAPASSGDCHESSGGSGHETSAAAAPAKDGHKLAGRIQSGVLVPHDGPCAHCVGRPQTQRALSFERQAEQTKRLDDARPAGVDRPAVSHFNTSTPLVAPIRGAPPGAAAAPRHLLLGIFRI